MRQMLVVAAVIDKQWSEDGDTEEHRKRHRWPEYKSKGKLRWSWKTSAKYNVSGGCSTTGLRGARVWWW